LDCLLQDTAPPAVPGITAVQQKCRTKRPAKSACGCVFWLTLTQHILAPVTPVQLDIFVLLDLQHQNVSCWQFVFFQFCYFTRCMFALVIDIKFCSGLSRLWASKLETSLLCKLLILIVFGGDGGGGV
jgi:hypothetical protein